MPNRIVREGILTSRRVNRLTAEEEVFYRRLHSVVDDFGRTFADPSLLRAALYPLRLDEVGERAIEGYLEAAAAADLIVLYAAEGEKYLEILRFRQQVRAAHSKHPAPADAQQTLRPCAADATPLRTKARANPEAKSKTKTTEEREARSSTPSPGIHNPPPADAGALALVLNAGEEAGKKTKATRRAPARSNFVPPAPEEVRAYLVEIGAVFTAERFISHHENTGWRVGKAPGFPMKDWRAACRTWKARDDEEGRTAAPGLRGPARAQAGPPSIPDWKRHQEDLDAANAAAEIADAERVRREAGLPC